MSRHRAPLALAALLGLAGVMHFRKPEFFDPLVPEQLPGGPRRWTHVSGVAELAVAAAVAVPATRRTGGLAAAALFVAVFPGNLKMARDWRTRSTAERAVAYGRLPLQVPLVLWALKVRRSATAGGVRES
ncbi:hypothetical protein [Kitasatospora sp. McL0602]|uniref:hypothetical protein n=1 Tax=Kitasatospora sp. McL0602 TaxID=3439530 RepID=UPI003F8C7D0D